jgi:geranylgeranyl pyrophosphate synthase
MKKVLQGELTQMTCTFNPDQTIRDYLRNINGKTAELIRLSCQEGLISVVQTRNCKHAQNELDQRLA